jgi:hypothetical protein
MVGRRRGQVVAPAPRCFARLPARQTVFVVHGRFESKAAAALLNSARMQLLAAGATPLDLDPHTHILLEISFVHEARWFCNILLRGTSHSDCSIIYYDQGGMKLNGREWKRSLQPRVLYIQLMESSGKNSLGKLVAASFSGSRGQMRAGEIAITRLVICENNKCHTRSLSLVDFCGLGDGLSIVCLLLHAVPQITRLKDTFYCARRHQDNELYNGAKKFACSKRFPVHVP